MPGLLRGVARTAVVAGTATAVSNRVSRRQANRWAGQEAAAPAYMAPVQQPAYQEPTYQPAPPAGVRTAFVLEGSSVAVVVRGVNKPLDRVTVAVAREGGGEEERGRQGTPSHERPSPFTLPLSPSPPLSLSPSPDRRTWTLDPAGTPFESIREPFEFTVTATDAEGLSPAEPLTGSIRLRADRRQLRHQLDRHDEIQQQ